MVWSNTVYKTYTIIKKNVESNDCRIIYHLSFYYLSNKKSRVQVYLILIFSYGISVIIRCMLLVFMSMQIAFTNLADLNYSNDPLIT